MSSETLILIKPLHRIINRQIAGRLKGRKYYMSFDFQRKLLWFRVAKCATRTIDELLLGSDYIYGPMRNYFPFMYRNWFKFAFIRNPVSRFKSCYQDKIVNDIHFTSRYSSRPEGQYFPKMSVDEFINFIDQHDTHSPQTDQHIRSQSSMIDLDNIDFVGTVENFDRDIQRIVKTDVVPHINKSKAAMLKLTDSQENRLKKIYSVDFDLFDRINKKKVNELIHGFCMTNRFKS